LDLETVSLIETQEQVDKAVIIEEWCSFWVEVRVLQRFKTSFIETAMIQARLRRRPRNYSWTTDNDPNIVQRQLIGLGGNSAVHEVLCHLIHRCSIEAAIKYIITVFDPN
jgi:hypothetical protein